MTLYSNAIDAALESSIFKTVERDVHAIAGQRRRKRGDQGRRVEARYGTSFEARHQVRGGGLRECSLGRRLGRDLRGAHLESVVSILTL